MKTFSQYRYRACWTLFLQDRLPHTPTWQVLPHGPLVFIICITFTPSGTRGAVAFAPGFAGTAFCTGFVFEASAGGLLGEVTFAVAIAFGGGPFGSGGLAGLDILSRRGRSVPADRRLRRWCLWCWPCLGPRLQRS